MSAVIEILSNVRCRVTGLAKSVYKALDDECAMPIVGAHFAGRGKRTRGHWDDGKKHHFYWPDKKEDKATFPKGLLSRVQSSLDDLEVNYVVRDKRKRVLPACDTSTVTADILEGISMSGIYSYQLDVTINALTAECGILWLATNAGKTEVMAAITKTLKDCVVLVVVPNKKLLYQTRDRLALRLGTIPSEIGIIGDGHFAPSDVTVAIVNSVAPKTVRKRGTALARRQAILKKYLKQVECVFFDEGHHTKAKTWFALTQAIGAQYRYVLSGTPFGSGDALTVESACGPVIARITNDELIQLGVSAKPLVRMIEIDKPILDQSAGIDGWHSVYQEGIVHNVYRNGVLAREAAKFSKAEKRTLILVKQLAQGDMLHYLIQDQGVPVEFVHARMSTDHIDDAIARFDEDPKSVLIASPIFDEGVDIPNMRALIIADAGKSVRSTLQKIGRGVRKKKTGANVIDVVDCADLTSQWLSDHSLDRLEIYEGEGFEVKFETPKEEEEGVDGEEEEDDSREALQRILRKVTRRDTRDSVPKARVQRPVEECAEDVRAVSRRMLWHRRAAS